MEGTDMQEQAGITVVEGQPSSMMVFDPDRAIGDATKAATAITQMVRDAGMAKRIGESEHLEVEAWQAIGQFYGCTCRTERTRELDDDKGWEAVVVILNTQGVIVGGAEAECRRDESQWESKPTFQLKSMAQTRAAGKAYRMMFGWVARLGGWAGTPAEEMDGVTPGSSDVCPQCGDPIVLRVIQKGGWIGQKRGKCDSCEKWFSEEEVKDSQVVEVAPPVEGEDVIEMPPAQEPTVSKAEQQRRQEFAAAYADAQGIDVTEIEAEKMRFWLAGSFNRETDGLPGQLSFNDMSAVDQKTAIDMAKAEARGRKEKAELPF
jgi:hypothetical protein